jgi:hypothetical protein
VVTLSAARGTYYVGQKVKVYGTVTGAGSNGATVQTQFISVDSPDGDAGNETLSPPDRAFRARGCGE